MRKHDLTNKKDNEKDKVKDNDNLLTSYNLSERKAFGKLSSSALVFSPMSLITMDRVAREAFEKQIHQQEIENALSGNNSVMKTQKLDGASACEA